MFRIAFLGVPLIFAVPIVFYFLLRGKKPLSKLSILKIGLAVAFAALDVYTLHQGIGDAGYALAWIIGLPSLMALHWIFWIFHAFRKKGVSLLAQLIYPFAMLLNAVTHVDKFLEIPFTFPFFLAFFVFLIVAHIWEKRQPKAATVPLPESETDPKPEAT